MVSAYDCGRAFYLENHMGDDKSDDEIGSINLAVGGGDEIGSINLAVENDCTIQVSSKVTVQDALVLKSGGKVVGRLDAVYDFKDLDSQYHMAAARIIQKRVCLIIRTEQALARQDKEPEIYRRRKKEFEVLPWWKKLFAKKPWEFNMEEE
jgi:hypothetical protein